MIQHMRPAMAKSGRAFLREFVHRRMTAPRTRPDAVKKISGGLIRSFQAEVIGRSLKNMRLKIFSTSRIAAVHEYGATIRPKQAKFLTIPSKFAKTPGGSLRFTAREIIAARGRGAPGLKLKSVFFGESEAGNLILFGVRDVKNPARAKFGGLVPLFILKKRVRIPPRLNFRKDFRDRLPRFRREMVVALRRAADKVGDG